MGMVQGVGFRPHIYRLANEQGLNGIVYNDLDGLHIQFVAKEESAGTSLLTASGDRTAKIWNSSTRDCLLTLAGHTNAAYPTSRSGWRPQKTPGVKKIDVEERISLKAAESKAYRALAALANYMALDRCDIGFATKESSKSMSSPAVCDVGPLNVWDEI